MNSLLPDLASVHLRETAEQVVVEVAVPAEVRLFSVSSRRVGGVIEIHVPRVVRRQHRIEGFHPEASGV